MNKNSKSNPLRSMTNKPLKWALLAVATVGPMTAVILWRHFVPQISPETRTTPEVIAESNRVLESTSVEIAKFEQFQKVEQEIEELISVGKLDEATTLLDKQIADTPDNQFLPQLYAWLILAYERQGDDDKVQTLRKKIGE